MFADKTKIFSKVLFYIFVFFLPWQTRMIFTPEKPELLSFSIYLSEIFLWLALAFWLTGADLKKILPNPPLQKEGTANTPPFEKGRLGGILVFSFLVFLSIFWSPDRVAAFRLWLFIFDGIMIYIFLREHGELRQKAAKVFLFSLFIASLFGIWQFFNLGSPAWKWLGLAARGAWNLGDIVVAADGGRWLRAYGPFPHPNIFGGYLAVGLIILFNFLKTTQSSRSYKTRGIYFLAATLFFALFLTFSRSAWVAFAVAAIYFIFEFYKKKRLTLTCAAAQVNVNDKRENILKFFIFLFALAITFSIIFWPLFSTRATSAGRLEQKSNTERVGGWKIGLSSWLAHPVFGAGLGNSIITNYELRITNKIQEPAHNIFLIALAELGLVGFMIYLFLWRGFWKNPALRPLLILFFVIGMLDHYLWTFWSGQMLFWLGLAIQEDM